MFNLVIQLVYLLLVVLANAQKLTQQVMISLETNTNAMENPEETGPYLEGDIKDESGNNRKLLRNGVIDPSLRWPRAIVPYEIEGHFSTNELGIIHQAFEEYHKKTCVRFRKRTNEKDYIVLVSKPNGCWSHLGCVGGRQEVNLESTKCFSKYGTTVHELMHALGFYHEQNRYERDTYVRVLTENIKPNMLQNFRKLSFQTATGYGVAYDYASIMHYKSNAFTRNGKQTLEALNATPEALRMGQRDELSNGDIFKIKAMYKCKNM